MSRFVKLMLAFLLIIGLLSAMFSGVAIFLIGNRVVAEAQDRVDSDLNAAQEMYVAYSAALYDLVRFSAGRFYLREVLRGGYPEAALGELLRTMLDEGLDFISLTDGAGVVLLRVGNPGVKGDSQAGDSVVAAAIESRLPVVGTAVFDSDRLAREAPAMAEEARLELVETQAARPREETVETSGLVLQAAAPVLDYTGGVNGVLH